MPDIHAYPPHASISMPMLKRPSCLPPRQLSPPYPCFALVPTTLEKKCSSFGRIVYYYYFYFYFRGGIIGMCQYFEVDLIVLKE